MCDSAIINGKYIDGFGELRAAIGGEPVIHNAYIERGKPYNDNTCLCPVDFEKTAEKFNMNYVQHDWNDNYSCEAELTTKDTPND